MTSKLTIEQARRLRNDFECWQQDYDPKDDKEQYDMFGRGMAAMDMLIAGMYQEPVAFINGAWTLVYYRPPKESGLKIGDKLYRHAQPAPVVMDDTKLRELFDSWFASDCSFDLSPEDSEADNIAWRESYWYLWQRCRAAMLQAGNSPVIPGWIPVSERMPENKPGCYKYLVFETLNNRVNHDYWNVPDKGDEAFTLFWNYYGEHVTHWMPLPAAPQEVKGE